MECNKSIWLGLLNELLKLKCLRKHLKTLTEACANWFSLPGYIINLACVIKKRFVQAKIANELSEALVNCMKNCSRVKLNLDPP